MTNYTLSKRKKKPKNLLLLCCSVLFLCFIIINFIITPKQAVTMQKPQDTAPTTAPTIVPTVAPTIAPTVVPTIAPTAPPTKEPSIDAPIDKNYFKNTLFIGDSRTEGLFINTGLRTASFYTQKGLTVSSIYRNRIVKLNSGRLGTVFEALKETKYEKIYIMLGVNELGWPYVSTFIDKYSAIIKDIKELQPKAKIYVQSILPVSSKVSNSDKIYNNKNINKFNDAIVSMCDTLDITYLPVNTAVWDEHHSLPEEAATDGIHLNKSYCIKWLDFLKKHS